MGEYDSVSRRTLLAASVTGVSVGIAGCGEQTPNQADPGEAPTEPENLTIEGYQLSALESSGDEYDLECIVNIQNSEPNYSVASGIDVEATVSGGGYSISDEIAVKSGSEAEFSYVLSEDDFPENDYHLMNADSSDVNLQISLGGELRVDQDTSGEITKS